MNWESMLKAEVETAYRSARGLVAMVRDDELGWKPSAGSNWMTVGQLTQHITIACGFCMNAFATGNWCPDERSEEQKKESEGKSPLPPTEELPTSRSVSEALERLDADKRVALAAIDAIAKAGRWEEQVAAPWGVTKSFGQQYLDMVHHLNQHKAQLFYYLKMLGRPVNTMHMWGMNT